MKTIIALAIMLSIASSPVLSARQWTFAGIAQPVEAEFVAMANGYVVFKGSNDKSFEVPLANLSQADQKFIKLLESGEKPASGTSGRPVTSRGGYTNKSVETLAGRLTTLDTAMELHITGTGDPITGSSFNFTSPDGWLFFDRIVPSVVEKEFLDRFVVNGARAKVGKNIRLAQYGGGTVVIPHGPDFAAVTVFEEKSRGGRSMPLECHVEYGDAKLGAMKSSISSFVLKRGYMATIAQNKDGTGASRNYVAQDHDVVVETLPKELDDAISFVRVFPWRWTSKKGIAGGIHEGLNVGWFYDWNIGAKSSPDLEYVAIKQKRGWPSLAQDWKAKGINHLLGFNEPDHKDQADLTVDASIGLWPELLGTGLRLGSPGVSDGGLAWLYQFMEKADANNLRVDFVAVHYYRASGDPGDARGAANRMRDFLEDIHNRVKRPIWITEWNNGANWTSAPDPNEKQQKAAVEAMIEMLDETPYVERYALYNWVEDSRQLKRKDGSLTPAGEVYRDKESPVFFVQPKSVK